MANNKTIVKYIFKMKLINFWKRENYLNTMWMLVYI